MALNPSGAISLGGTTSGQSIALENGGPGTVVISLNDSGVRSLAGVPTGVITMPTDFWGKSNTFTFTLASGTDVNLRSAAISAGWPGSGAVQANIPAANTIQASSTGTYALTIDGTWPGGVTVVNSGTIVGRGGAGGNGATFNGTAGGGGTGGTAILASVPVTFNNASGTIAGGGGGGGGGGGRAARAGIGGGGGGGGGNGFGSAGPASGGTNPGGAGSASTSALSGGAGGGGANGAGPGGAGGSNAGAGASGNTPGNNAGGGSGGNAVSGNPLITFPALGTIYGPRV